MIFQERKILIEAGFREIDIFFAEFICKISGDDDIILKTAAICVSMETGAGHVCLDMKAFSNRDISEIISDSGVKTGIIFPEFETMMKLLPEKKSVVGFPGEEKPLILDRKGRLYLHRYHEYEKNLSKRILHFISIKKDDLDIPLAGKIIDEYFKKSDEMQSWAARLAVSRGLIVVSGGPGTGKTSTVVKIISLIYRLYEKNGTVPMVALAAPTGKAAARLKESFDSAAVSAFSKSGSGHETGFLASIGSSTIHRLLRHIRATPFFRYNRENRLPHDMVVVDEFSMADIALASKLFDSIRDDARVILLGDRDQLSSVESGSVLADICDASVSPVVFFNKSYRFGPDSGIGIAADLIRTGESSKLISLLKSGKYKDIILIDHGNRFSPKLIPDAFFSNYKAAVGSGDPLFCINEIKKYAFLCAHRKGEFGVDSLNRLIEERLYDDGVISRGRRWYSGRPLIIKTNSAGLALYNGDTGVILRDDSEEYAYFPEGDGVKKYHPSRLPEHETAFSMTIHKSQGSEFDNVIVLLPPSDSAMLVRELLYTAVTRARRNVIIISSEQSIRRAVENQVSRNSGLRDALDNLDQN